MPRVADGRGGVSITPSQVATVNKIVGTDNVPNIAFLRYELAHLLPTYHLIRDCLLGEQAIKLHDKSGSANAGMYNGGFVPFGAITFTGSGLYGANTLGYTLRYLPKPNSADISIENTERYRQYIERAVFYAVTHWTLEGLIGALFLRAPVVELPTGLEHINEDATGSGVSLLQFGKQLSHYVLAYGRAGILADYPTTNGVITVAERATGAIRTSLAAFAPWEVINWRTRRVGSETRLCLVVIAETAVAADDGFKEDYTEQYRVLFLTPDNRYQVITWRREIAANGSTGRLVFVSDLFPTDANGKPFDHIPFTFVGPVDNGPSVDRPPAADLAALNMAHYRNSADYEESVYWCGQPTPVFTGLTQEWVNNVMGGAVTLGSRAVVMLPTGGTAELLQAKSAVEAKEAMEHKEAQMRALGARLIEENRVQKTATEASHDEAAQQSVLASAGANCSKAILWALQRCALFEGVAYTDDSLKFEINTELDLIKLSPEARKQLMEEWQAGGISFTEYRHNLHRSGIATQDDATATAEIKANPPLAQAAMLASIATAETNARVQP